MNTTKQPPARMVYVITHTHWDREWYEPVEVYRFRLIELIERLQVIFERNPDYHSFFLDGQTVPLEDILAVRPELEPWLRRQIKAGRLRLGPFYVLLDEQLVCGESFVRNLIIGRDMVRRYSGTAEVGYLPDNFGHVSQTPQILRGFNLDNAVMWRGLEADQDLPNECHWRSPDGSEVFLFVLQGNGYASAAGMMPDDPASFDRALDSLERLKARTARPAILLMYGVDHAFPHPETKQALAILQQRAEGITVKHSDLESFLAAARGQATDRVLQGERIVATHLDATFSSRLILKQMNRVGEMELTAYAEPLAVLAALTGAAYPGADLQRAWKKLIRCHAHDSITGCHADAVAEDVRVRLRRSREIAAGVTDLALERLLGCRLCYADPTALRILTVFNPVPAERRAVIRAEVYLPVDAPPVQEITVHGQNETCVANVLGGEDVYWPQRSDYWVPKAKPCRRHTIEFGPVKLQPLGLTCFKVEVVEKAESKITMAGSAHVAGEESKVAPPTISPRPDVLENALVQVVVRPDGSLDVTDKQTGKHYPGLHALEAEQDAGDLYYCAPMLDRARYAFIPSERRLLENCPTGATIRISGTLQVPAGMDSNGYLLRATVECPVSVAVTLKRDDPLIYFRTTIENRARNICWRARFDSGLTQPRCFTHTPFDIVERPPLSDQWFYAGAQCRASVLTRYAAQEFVSLYEGGQSLTLLNRGLPEYTFHRGGLLTLTLLRSTGAIWGWRIKPNPPTREYPSETGFELGVHEREYALLVHAGPIAESPVLRDAVAYNRPPRVRWTDKTPAQSFTLRLEPAALVLTALKQAEDGKGYVIRFHNVTDNKVAGRLALPKAFARIVAARLDETLLEEIARNTDLVTLTVPARKIVTLRLLEQ